MDTPCVDSDAHVYVHSRNVTYQPFKFIDYHQNDFVSCILDHMYAYVCMIVISTSHKFRYFGGPSLFSFPLTVRFLKQTVPAE